MIISKTPFRISFFGGGTDYPEWYKEHGGSVLATTIDKYCYITCRHLPPFFEHKTRISYSQIELVHSNDEIRHPSVRETLKFMGLTEGLEIHTDGDLPARTGLGSSSTFTVGLLNCLYALKGQMTSKMQLATEAIHIEQNLINENVGSQDQTMAAFGGLNKVEFKMDGSLQVTPIILRGERQEQLQKNLMLFYTGISRSASQIAGDQIKETRNKIYELTEMNKMVDQAIKILCSNSDITDFGRLLYDSWQFKRSLTTKVSNPYIDYIFETAMNSGAIGGKLLGAGGGGFILLFVPQEKQKKVKESLGGLLQVPIRFEYSGSQIIYYNHTSEKEQQSLKLASY
ncbi:MAG TPA: hypothetical protein VMS09_08265 [Paenibacillus sp.]|uniref:GHMP family kinase ATP-binding protein n=1 Tax=Paenibacillus sp. TaxID=58172 RepID=UPI002BBFB6E0|nr:hypothetical protein [Paenibacillus sp.]HUC92008.1 hypothetical protein [Paenibacillus sp.]